MEIQELITVSQDATMTAELLDELITKHKKICQSRYFELQNAYNGIYKISLKPHKDDGKPDNRIVCNFAKSLTDVMNGFFLGIPIKTTSADDEVTEWVNNYKTRNRQDDLNSEISKNASIFGVGYEMLYVNEESEICATYVKPTEGFMVYDDSVLRHPKFFIRYYKNVDGEIVGSYSDESIVRHFKDGIFVDEETPHYFEGVPAIEYKENEERLGLFETVLSIINAYNKALSAKGDDVDYFADAYLMLLGHELSEQDIVNIRRNRVVNLYGEEAAKYKAEFLVKPSADTTQENYLTRLEKLIYNISMVADINDENFGSASGIAIRYRLWGMSSRAKDKERKFTAALTDRYRLICSHPLCDLNDDAYKELEFTFTQNFPANIADEANTARTLEGIVSKETQLATLSIVGDVPAEIERINDEYKLDDLGWEQNGTKSEEQNLLDKPGA